MKVSFSESASGASVPQIPPTLFLPGSGGEPYEDKRKKKVYNNNQKNCKIKKQITRGKERYAAIMFGATSRLWIKIHLTILNENLVQLNHLSTAQRYLFVCLYRGSAGAWRHITSLIVFTEKGGCPHGVGVSGSRGIGWSDVVPGK